MKQGWHSLVVLSIELYIINIMATKLGNAFKKSEKQRAYENIDPDSIECIDISNILPKKIIKDDIPEFQRLTACMDKSDRECMCLAYDQAWDTGMQGNPDWSVVHGRDHANEMVRRIMGKYNLSQQEENTATPSFF